MTDSPGWFVGVLLFEAEHPDEPDYADHLYEKRVVLFSGQDEAAAQEKTSEYCASKEVAYLNPDGARVIWRCRRVLAVTPLYDAEIADGVEVYSELLVSDPDAMPS